MIWLVVLYVVIGIVFGVIIETAYSGERDNSTILAIVVTSLCWPAVVIYLLWPGK